ncbi:hypothetical protein QIS99_29030 [Streptomyces sp. B-S-A8]|uniref:DUF2637 domain-containing protein n=1 Tax=Streptomyces solicavernae TaxID=3043614 RepID=A0ABT6S0K3_9ACTN|nr:hypothetical protein [Streptomyces sp. B-S-A8]MDI3390205.1 hypothetical protein [Streptomyces sp. B-S-A8]
MPQPEIPSAPKRGTPALRLSALAAALCTAYSADTSWRFAADHLGMYGTAERIAMFAAGELALLATALLARQNLHSDKRSPGLPGVLVWVITAVLIIPAYAESGLVGGTVRAFLGPVMAAVLWHLAMGIELRHRTANAASSSVASRVGRELRERFLSRLGIADRSRNAQEITRDRATIKAAVLASRIGSKPKSYRATRLGRRALRRLSDALDRAEVAIDAQQHERFLARYSARRNIAALFDANVTFSWETADYQPVRRSNSGKSPAGKPSGTGPRTHDHSPPSGESVPEAPAPKPRQKTAVPEAKREPRNPSEEPEPPRPVPEPDEPEAPPRRAGRPSNTSDDDLIAIARDLESRTGSVSHTAMRAELNRLNRKAANQRIAAALEALHAERNGGTPEAPRGT